MNSDPRDLFSSHQIPDNPAHPINRYFFCEMMRKLSVMVAPSARVCRDSFPKETDNGIDEFGEVG